MIHEQVWQHVTVDDFPPGSDAREMAEIIGPEATLRVMKRLGKTALYLSTKSLEGFYRRFIAENVHSMTPKEMARLLDLSESHVYVYMRENSAKRSSEEVRRNQVDLFPESR